jgi:hypothetical protein
MLFVGKEGQHPHDLSERRLEIAQFESTMTFGAAPAPA